MYPARDVARRTTIAELELRQIPIVAGAVPLLDADAEFLFLFLYLISLFFFLFFFFLFRFYMYVGNFNLKFVCVIT